MRLSPHASAMACPVLEPTRAAGCGSRLDPFCRWSVGGAPRRPPLVRARALGPAAPVHRPPFACLTAPLALAAMARRVRLLFGPGPEPQPGTYTTLSPDGGIRVQLPRRRSETWGRLERERLGMDPAALAHGAVLALALIAPLGPQNTLVLGEGVRSAPYRAALPVALTAALCDTLLIAIGLAGLSFALRVEPRMRDAITACAAIYLTWFGLSLWRAGHGQGAPGAALATAPASTLRGRLARIVAMSLLNPHAVLDTVVVLGAGAAVYRTAAGRVSFALAAALVSWLWFPALAAAGHLVGRFRAGWAYGAWPSRLSAMVMWTVAAGYVLGLRALWP